MSGLINKIICGTVNSLSPFVILEETPNQPPVARCVDATVPTDPGVCQATSADINEGSFDPDDDQISLQQAPAGPYGLGETQVTLMVIDELGLSDECTATVTVTDRQAPAITAITVSPNVLWPPNHKMVQITPTVTAADNCGGDLTIGLESISMNEGDETTTSDLNHENTMGDGNTTDDVQVDGAGNISLRAERSGSSSGRTYTITYSATDASGNTSEASAVVTVPHNKWP